MCTRPPDRRYQGSRSSIPGSIRDPWRPPCTGPPARRTATRPRLNRPLPSAYSAVRENRYDLIHNHAFDAPAISLAAGLDTPVVHTLHLPPDAAIAAALRQAAQGGQPPAVACVSAFQASIWRAVARVDAILPPYVRDAFRPLVGRGGGRRGFRWQAESEKGAAEAIDIAQAAGAWIDVYGDVYDAEYARDQIAPGEMHPA